MMIAWTGHRPDLFSDPVAARQAVDAEANDLTKNGATRFLVGGQRGVDTWAAQAAIRLAVPFSLILPLAEHEFTLDWPSSDRAAFEQTLAVASEVRIADGYTERNRQLATGADLLVAVWTGVLGGGTAETIDLARAAGTPLREVVLDPAPAARSARGRGI